MRRKWQFNSTFTQPPPAAIFGVTLLLSALPCCSTARSDSPPRLQPFQRWRARRWPLARERYARGAPDFPRPRRRRRTQSRPRGFRRGPEPELELLQDPCRGNSQDYRKTASNLLILPLIWCTQCNVDALLGSCIVALPEHVAQREFRDVLLQDFNLRTNENPSIHFSNPIGHVLHYQLLKAPADRKHRLNTHTSPIAAL